MNIVTLIENLTYNQGLYAEHGLSIYIKAVKKNLLFDTGQTGCFIKNAEKLKIDISDVDALIISHGHYDHTGGISEFIKVNNKAKIYIKETAFEKKIHNDGRQIGIPIKYEEISDRVSFVKKAVEIDKNIFICPDIKIYNKNDTHFDNLFVKRKDGAIEVDEFDDELYLAVIKENTVNIFSGCSHRGITNILQSAIDRFKLPISHVIGGFHTRNEVLKTIHNIAHYFEKADVCSLGACHCTGVEEYAELKSILKDKIYYNYTGMTTKI